jgi:hypothetical protein
MTKTQIKLVAVMQGMTESGTKRRAIWLMASVRNSSPYETMTRILRNLLKKPFPPVVLAWVLRRI